MTNLTSFRTSLRWFLLGTSLVIILLYTLFLGQFFAQGLVASNSVELSLIAKEYEARLQIDPGAPPPEFLNILIYTNWADVPEPYQSTYSLVKLSEDKLEVKAIESDEGAEDYSPDVYFLFPHKLQNGEWLYVTRLLPAGSIDEGLRDEFNTVGIFVRFTIAIVILLIVMLLTQLFYRHINRRITQLEEWTDTVTLENLPESPPDMGFKEFTQISDRLYGAYKQLKEITRREKEFLSHASHELRTPIAVIRNNLELIKRNELPDELINPIERINRASGVMQSLTETLLLLSKGSKMEIPRTDVDVSELLKSQILTHEYLLKDKDVRVETDIPEKSDLVNIELTALGIVTANLLRNAYQHTYNGIVQIHLKGKEIIISNKSETENAEDDESDNYNIGLKLCRQICESFGWKLLMEPMDNGMQVRLNF
jgi:signal transduction histidine kinase